MSLNIVQQSLMLGLFILKCIYFMLPAYVANMAPVFVRKINILNKPIDFGIKLKDNNRLFGKNKTWRGIFFGVLAGFIVFLIQKLLYSQAILKSMALINYSDAGIAIGVLLGIFLGLGALLGDLAGSFVKRRLRIKEGRPAPVLDEIGFVFGALLFSFWLLSWQAIIVILIISPVLHMLANFIGYRLRIRVD